MVLFEDKDEVNHVFEVLRAAQRALKEGNASELQRLSDQTIHSASIHQHTDFIIIPVLMYSLYKILLRKEKLNFKKWSLFVRKFNAELDKSLEALKNQDAAEFARHLGHSKSLLEEISPIAKQDVAEVVRKASINKASRLYEHGISLPQTAKLLGVSQWELAEYIGHKEGADNPYTATVDIKKRAKIALDFFS